MTLAEQSERAGGYWAIDRCLETPGYRAVRQVPPSAARAFVIVTAPTLLALRAKMDATDAHPPQWDHQP